MAVRLLEPGDVLMQVHRLVELRRLRAEFLYQVLGQNPGEARNVEDELLRIERGELATQFRQGVDELRRRAAHAGVEEAEDPGGAAADDRDLAEFVRGEGVRGHAGKVAASRGADKHGRFPP